MCVYEIYTDGASSPNLAIKPGGWSVILTQDNALIGHFEGNKRDTTNQVMELTAVCKALQWIQKNLEKSESVTIVSDSKYALNGLLEHWYKMWEFNGMLTSTMEPPKNLELWKETYEVYLQVYKDYNLTLKHVKGHKGNTYNELADKYAVKAKKEVR